MEQETQILLERLIETVKAPEWLSVIATIIAAIVAAMITYVLGRRQNELQQQQLKLQERQNELQEQQNKIQEYQTKLQEQQIQQQEYDLYRRIYAYIWELDFFNKTMLHKIVTILIHNEDNKLRLKQIDGILQEYEKQAKGFNECTLDIELKQCGEGLDVKYYYDALQASSKVIQMVRCFVEEYLLKFTPSLIYNTSIENPDTPLEELIDIILQLFKGSNPQLLQSELLAYAEIIEKTNQAQILEIIKQRITPNNTL